MISVFGSNVGPKEILAVQECMESQWMGFGQKVLDFEEKFKCHAKLDNFAMVDSGSNALYMAISLLNLPKQSEIILPSFTWVSCAQAVLLAGHIPVFCDVDLNTMNIRLEDIEPHITKKTAAVMVVHYAGKPVDVDPIKELGFPIIEDAAHAVDSYYNGKICGSLGDVGIYSFDAVKNLTVGEGGGITAKDRKLIERAEVMRYCGIGKSGFDAARGGKSQLWWEYNIQEPFIKMLPTNIAASIGIVQLDRLDELQLKRKTIWKRYQKAFAEDEWIVRPQEPSGNQRHSYFTYAIRTPKRNQLAKYLLDKEIYTTLRYHPLHLNTLYNSNKRLPNCEQLNLDCLSIPLHPNLTQDQVSFIIESILNFKRYV